MTHVKKRKVHSHRDDKDVTEVDKLKMANKQDLEKSSDEKHEHKHSHHSTHHSSSGKHHHSHKESKSEDKEKINGENSSSKSNDKKEKKDENKTEKDKNSIKLSKDEIKSSDGQDKKHKKKSSHHSGDKTSEEENEKIKNKKKELLELDYISVDNPIKNNYVLSKINDGILHRVGKKLREGKTDLEVRNVQASVFMASVNTCITDSHKASIGPDKGPGQLFHYLIVCITSLIIAAAIITIISFGFLGLALKILEYFFYFFFALEYALAFASLKCAHYPPKPEIDSDILEMPEMSETSINRPTQIPPNKIALIIPVGWGVRGLSDAQKNERREAKMKVLDQTIQNALNVFPAVDIFIFHNSSDLILPDPVVQKTCEGRSVYVPLAIGSKSLSVYYGAILSKWLGYHMALVMDDDTALPIELSAVLKEPLTCDAYCLAIGAGYAGDGSDLSGFNKTLVGIQDIEYKLSDLMKITQANWTTSSSVLAPHGALNLWRTDMLIDIMNSHNACFEAEDYQMGKLLRQLYPDSKCGMISAAVINTIAPDTFGQLFRQRYASWDLAVHQMMTGGVCASPSTAFFLHVLCCMKCSVDNLYIRIVTLEDVWTALQDYLRIPFNVLLIYRSITERSINILVIVMYLIAFLTQWIIAICLEYGKFKTRPDLQVPKDTRLKAVLLFPLHRFLFSYVRCLAMLRFFFVYNSIKRTAVPIAKMYMPQPRKTKYLYPGLAAQELEEEKLKERQQRVSPSIVKDVIAIALKEVNDQQLSSEKRKKGKGNKARNRKIQEYVKSTKMYSNYLVSGNGVGMNPGMVGKNPGSAGISLNNRSRMIRPGSERLLISNPNSVYIRTPFSNRLKNNSLSKTASALTQTNASVASAKLLMMSNTLAQSVHQPQTAADLK